MNKIKNKYIKKILIALIINISIISITTIIKAKYILQNEFYIADLNIDRTKPKIELISITNTNTGYESYANKTHEIKVTVKITEKNLKDIFCDKEHVKIKIDDKYINIKSIEFKKIQDFQEVKIYEIKLQNIEENGKLKIEFIEGIAVDISELKNDKIEFDTNIIIDNIPPDGKISENKISNGKVNAIINFNEKIRKIEGWKVSEDMLKAEKEFTNNISYQLPIIDYAGNKSVIEIAITQATYINIIYASHNSEIGWTFGYGNYDIAGKNAIIKNPKFKTEALAFNISGNIEADFLQAKTYINTYWGEGTYAKCKTSGLIYNYGYNPNNGIYKSMNSSGLVTINGKKYFQFGGSGINTYGNTDINGNNPIPSSIASQYRYGICGINIKLKDYSQFSVVYQILVNETGWIKACSDGEECMYNKQKPMSEFRITLIPKSEKNYVLDTWNKDIGTYNIN